VTGKTVLGMTMPGKTRLDLAVIVRMPVRVRMVVIVLMSHDTATMTRGRFGSTVVVAAGASRILLRPRSSPNPVDFGAPCSSEPRRRRAN
jgi:hypothetical protein